MSSNARREEKRRERELQEIRDSEVRQQRWIDLYLVPEAARSEYLDMEDVIGEAQAQSIFAFIEAMKETK